MATLFKSIARLNPELMGAHRTLSVIAPPLLFLVPYLLAHCACAYASLTVVHMSELLSAVLANLSALPTADVKAALTLFFWVSEGLPEEAMRTKLCEAFFGTILVAMLRSDVMAHSVRSLLHFSGAIQTR